MVFQLPKQARYQLRYTRIGKRYTKNGNVMRYALVARVAVPDKIFGLARFLDFIDRCPQIKRPTNWATPGNTVVLYMISRKKAIIILNVRRKNPSGGQVIIRE